MADWLPENSIIDPELAPLARRGFISKVTVIESEETGGYYVTMRIKPHEHTFHLATRRVRDQPRIYMNLGRLVTHIRQKMAPLRELKLMLIPEPEIVVKKKPLPQTKMVKTARKTGK